MILADKIIKLRKKNGWSQEELAEKMEVSRQAVSKWEGAQTVPDLEKVLRLSNLFGVTTDYLLKDEIEIEEFSDTDTDSLLRKISMEEANAFLANREWAAKCIAIATALCILSPLALIFLSIAGSHELVSGPLPVTVGLVVLFLMVAAAVVMLVYCGFKNSSYEFLDKGEFETEYGVNGMVGEKKKAFCPDYIKMNIIATVLCILAPVPLIIGSFSEKTIAVYITFALLFFMVTFAVMLFIYAGVRYASMQKLLKEGEFNRKNKNKAREAIESCFWLVSLAVYLGWSFISEDWHITWVVWPVAGVLSAALSLVLNIVFDKEE